MTITTATSTNAAVAAITTFTVAPVTDDKPPKTSNAATDNIIIRGSIQASVVSQIPNTSDAIDSDTVTMARAVRVIDSVLDAAGVGDIRADVRQGLEQVVEESGPQGFIHAGAAEEQVVNLVHALDVATAVTLAGFEPINAAEAKTACRGNRYIRTHVNTIQYNRFS